MTRTRQRFPLRKPRLALLALVALGFIAQTFMGISGQTHEFLLHADAGEAYTHQHVSHDHHTPVDGGSEDDYSSPLHPLLHQTCGAHCVGMMGTATFQPTLFLTAVAISHQNPRRVHAADYTAPFRPPIRA